MATTEIDIIKKRSSGLSKKDKLQLIDFLAKTLKNGGHGSQKLPFGKYRNARQSTAEDFEIAEWHPTSRDLNGN